MIDHCLEVEDFSPVKPDISRNDQFGFGVLNAVREGRALNPEYTTL